MLAHQVHAESRLLFDLVKITGGGSLWPTAAPTPCLLWTPLGFLTPQV